MLLLLLLGEYLPGRLRVHADRAGSVSEVTDFLHDLEAAYFALLRLESRLRDGERRRRYFPAPYPTPVDGADEFLANNPAAPRALPPEYRLIIDKVRLESPGTWEFLGSLNPLQQIREYLNDRHQRRQDREYREHAEIEKLRLENELLQRAVWEKENAVLRDRVQFLRDAGLTDVEVRNFIWQHAGGPLVALGRHQDAGLIRGAD
jgi:hypothetical protein